MASGGSASSHRGSDLNRAIVLGGTGLLGAQAVLALVADGYEVTSVSSRTLVLGDWYPTEVKQIQADLLAMDTAALASLLAGNDVVVHGFGPDDRTVPQAPAATFFGQQLVEITERVCAAAAEVGVGRVVVFGSYFTYFDRTEPARRLAARHPYINARVQQLAVSQRFVSKKMSVAVLEIPYVFGTMPERDPLWFDVLVRRIHPMRPWIFFPPGGTVMCSARFVGAMTAAVADVGRSGPIPVGEENMSWTTLLTVATEELYGTARRVVTIPPRVAAVYGMVEQLAAKARGLEPGLHYGRYITDVQARQSSFPEDLMASVAAEFGLDRWPITPEIRGTFRGCAALLQQRST